MDRENNSQKALTVHCDFIAKQVFRCPKGRIFRPILHSITVATCLLLGNVSPTKSEEEGKYISAFLADNPKINHQNFRGKIVNVLYSCTTGRTSSNLNICGYIDRDIKQSNFIHFIKSKNEDQYAINFLVTQTNYPNNTTDEYFKGCKKNASGQSIIFVSDDINSHDIDRCISISTLNFLGFNVNSLFSHAGDQINIDNIISLYTN